MVNGHDRSRGDRDGDHRTPRSPVAPPKLDVGDKLSEFLAIPGPKRRGIIPHRVVGGTLSFWWQKRPKSVHLFSYVLAPRCTSSFCDEVKSDRGEQVVEMVPGLECHQVRLLGVPEVHPRKPQQL